MNGASYDRVDANTLVVNGVTLNADEETETYIRSMSQEDLQLLLFWCNQPREDDDS